MEPVYIFCGSDSEQHALRIYGRREGKLHKNAIDFRTAVQSFDHLKQFNGLHVLAGGKRFAIDAQRGGGARLVSHIHFGSGIFASQNDGKPGWTAQRFRDPLNARVQFLQNLVPYAIAVKKGVQLFSLSVNASGLGCVGVC